MGKKIQDPVITGDSDRYTETHPAYGHLQVTRVQGGGQVLYGSDFVHNSSIQIQAYTSEMERNLSADWPHARKLLLSLRMSEAQWAAFVSGVGTQGTQCTLIHYEGGDVPGLPVPTNRKGQFTAEIQNRLEKALEKIDSLQSEMEAMSISKKAKEGLQSKLSSVTTEIKSNIPYTVRTFDEHMETTVEHAKAEVHGYMQHVLTRAGLKALQEKDLPLQLEEGKGGVE